MAQDPAVSKNLRIGRALGEIGPSVVVGAITTFLGIMVMAFASNAIFRVFFKMFIIIITFGVSAVDCVPAAGCRRCSALVGGVSTTCVTGARSLCARLVAITERFVGCFVPTSACSYCVDPALQLSPVS